MLYRVNSSITNRKCYTCEHFVLGSVQGHCANSEGQLNYCEGIHVHFSLCKSTPTQRKTNLPRESKFLLLLKKKQKETKWDEMTDRIERLQFQEKCNWSTHEMMQLCFTILLHRAPNGTSLSIANCSQSFLRNQALQQVSPGKFAN